MPFRTCIHQKSNGATCQSPAMRGKTRCYAHQQQFLRQLHHGRTIPDLSDPADRQWLLNQVMNALYTGDIDSRRASQIFYALQQ